LARRAGFRFVSILRLNDACLRYCRNRVVALEVLQKALFAFPRSMPCIFFCASYAAWRFDIQFLQHLSRNIAIFDVMVGGARADMRVNGWAFLFEFAKTRTAACSDCDGSWAGGVYLPLVVRGSAADVGIPSLLYIINTTAEANLSLPLASPVPFPT